MIHTEHAELEEALGYRFRDPAFLERALTHSSRRAEAKPKPAAEHAALRDNERLEFLGDSVLNLLVAEALLHAFPEWTEGELSKARARLVSAASLSEAARRIRLGQFLRLGRGEEKTGGRDKPAMLADAYEAVLAALFLDGGLDVVREVVHRTLLKQPLAVASHLLCQTDFKSGLQEYLQRRGEAPAVFRVIAETGPDHRKIFVVEVLVAGRPLASASGNNKKEAEQAAARLALEELAGKSRRGE